MPAPVRVRVTHTFTSDPQTVFDALSEHENLGRVFAPAKVSRLSDGPTSRNGAGSSRTVKVRPLLSLVETTTVSEPPTLIEYKITKGSGPVTGHHGIQRLTATGTGGTRLDYSIAFDSKIPGLAQLVALGLTQSLKRGLPKLVP